MFTSHRTVANRLIKILSDNTVMPEDWRYHIPMLIVQHYLPVTLNAKLLADGIDYNIELYGIELPEDKLIARQYSNEYNL